jgi:ethanolamine permease
MSVMGALVMYIISMASLLKLRQSEPLLERPYKAPFFPVFPLIALVCGIVCLFAVVYFNAMLSLLFVGLMAVAYAYFRLTSAQRSAAPGDAMLGTQVL